ncbi:MAG: GNAT family N-acetyltransferase [Gemmatimonadaceae bacterium]
MAKQGPSRSWPCSIAGWVRRTCASTAPRLLQPCAGAASRCNARRSRSPLAPAARGGGIGTALLEQLRIFAAAEGARTIRLEVKDRNDGARRLSERMRFVATRTSHFRHVRWLLGFSAATTQEYRLPRVA